MIPPVTPGAERTFSLAELAELCGLPATVVKRWVDRELLTPLRGAMHVYSFRSLGTARTLAQFWRAGWTAPRIARAWRLARAVVSDPDEALNCLLASIGHKRLVVRLSDGQLVELGGQMLFDFGAAAGTAPAVAPLALRSPADWFAIGVDAEAAGRLEDAVRAYERALSPDNPEAHFNLGNCYYALRRRAEAAEQFFAATSCAQDYAEAWNNLGIVRGELGDRDGAIAALQAALELVPHYADAHYNLAETLAVVGDIEGARRHWRAYLSFDPNSRWAEQVRRRLRSHGDR